MLILCNMDLQSACSASMATVNLIVKVNCAIECCSSRSQIQSCYIRTWNGSDMHRLKVDAHCDYW